MAGQGARRGLQTEVLLSLIVVMITATGVLAALLLRTHEVQLAQLRELAARALIAEASAGLPRQGAPGIRWWIIATDGSAVSHGGHRFAIDGPSRDLAESAGQRRQPLLEAGRPWDPIRLAAPVGDGVVAVAWLPPAASTGMVMLLALGTVAVFTSFGFSLLRGRLVAPLQRLATGARALADGELETRVAVDGVAETAEVASAFNEMAEALSTRTVALEKAVVDLRESNRSLRTARAGLDRAERLAAVGRLAAGVAHEVGNPMGALLAFLDLAQRDAGVPESAREHLRKASRQGERVRVILRELLDFTRPPRGTPAPMDLAAACEETIDLVRAQRRYAGIDMKVEVEGDPPLAMADRASVAQVVLNLVLNAADALGGEGEARRVRLIVRPGVAPREGEAPEAAAKRRHFDRVTCTVADNGPGIAPEDRERVFDPFYTTKPPGEGTGLGLSNALRLVEQQGGGLDLADSETGAAFVLWLPAVDAGRGGVRQS